MDLLTEAHQDRLKIVLVSPRNPLNIGAAARAMANFGYSSLLVVAAYEPHWREARSAVQAEDLLRNARSTQRLEEAIDDCTLVIGTGTLTHRKPEQPVIALPDLAPRIASEVAHGGRIALVFGPEKRGLTRDDLALCHLLVQIPTDPRQPSMNLGQAVAVCLYELVRQSQSGAAKPETEPADATPAAMHALELLAAVVADTMQAAHYSPAAMQAANRHDLNLLLRRLTLTQRDARRILGLFRRILRRLPA